MKDQDFTNLWVITADQRASRRHLDRVPQALVWLNESLADRLLLAFERTAGDEIQCLAADSAAVVDAALVLTRLGDWRLGIGFGPVDQPLPSSTREARGGVYLAARDAIQGARTAPGDLRLQVAESVSAPSYGELVDRARNAESAILVTCVLLTKRTEQGWEVADLLDQGLTHTEIARRLGISVSAASQRAARAQYAEINRGIELSQLLFARVAELEGSPR